MSKEKNRKIVLTLALSFVCLLFLLQVVVPRLIAWSIWERHEQVVLRAIQGKPVYGRDFENAVYFLSFITKVEARVNQHYAGISPTKHTADDLETWSEWLRENRFRLRWNYFRQEVQVVD